MDHIGYRNLALDFLNCADLLLEAHTSGTLKLRFDSPILATYAHATELAIKGNLLALGEDVASVVSFRHDLLKAYNRLGEINPALTRMVEQRVKEHWKVDLGNRRAEFEQALSGYGIESPKIQSDLGLPSKQEIGDSLPTYIKGLEWLSERHKRSGGAFRYYSNVADRRQVVVAFGFNIFTVPTSISIGTRVLCDAISLGAGSKD